jgi:hypothetical protein
MHKDLSKSPRLPISKAIKTPSILIPSEGGEWNDEKIYDSESGSLQRRLLNTVLNKTLTGP